MDIARYIGLFLLKNHFCYIHGLGNLELRKRSATQEGETLRGPSYEVVVTQGGSIDDNLANFIATNEFISISKASNALRDFSTGARAQLSEGKEVVIPNIGKFQELNGRISFITDPNLQYTPYAMPSMRTDRRQDEVAAAKPYTPPLPSMQTNAEPPKFQDTPEPGEAHPVDWKKVIIAAVILVVVIIACIVGYNFMKNKKADADATPKQTTVLTPPVTATPPKTDSMDATKAVDTPHTYNFVIEEDATRKKAEQKVTTMVHWGHDVRMVVQDSSMYLVVMRAKCLPADTSKMMDSLGRVYSYPGVSIYP